MAKSKMAFGRTTNLPLHEYHCPCPKISFTLLSAIVKLTEFK